MFRLTIVLIKAKFVLEKVKYFLFCVSEQLAVNREAYAIYKSKGGGHIIASHVCCYPNLSLKWILWEPIFQYLRD